MQLQALHINQIRYKNYINAPDAEMIDLYHTADLLTFVSTIEGFGMPILEAQASGLPVLTSNCSSMPEVAGDAAFFADPLDVLSIRKGILTALTDQNQRDQLVIKGYRNVKRFREDHIAEQYNLLYNSLS